MQQIEIKLGWKTHLLLYASAALILILELAAFFGLPRLWYLVTNLVLVPALVGTTFWLFARLANRKRHNHPGSE